MARSGRYPLLRLLAPAIAVLAAGGYLWLRAGDGSSAPAGGIGTVRRETLDRTVEATGVIRPQVGAEVQVGSRISGIVRALPVTVGELVEPGDLLARLDPTELQAALDQALADLDLAGAQLAMARASHERTEALSSRGIVSPSDLDGSLRDLEVARARLALEEARVRSASINLDFTEIRAPIRGVVADISTREGETVAASFAAPTFVTIVDLDRLEVRAYVDETDIGRVSIGQTATFTVDSFPEQELTARVSAVNPKAETINGVVNYVVILDFDPVTGLVLRPEMTARVVVQVDRRLDALTVPRRALRHDAGMSWVEVRRGEVWIRQDVRTGWRTDTSVEIEEGLEEGESVRIATEQEQERR